MAALISVVAASLLFAQEQAAQPAGKILDMTHDEQGQFIEATLDQGLPESRADEMTMLVINRSSLAIPLLEAKVEEWLTLDSPPQRFIDIASEMIAYAGDEEALKAIVKLVAINEKQFSPLVIRALTHAGNWRNPFTVAYRGLEMNNEAISRYTTAWVESALTSNRKQRAWAEAMLVRYDRVPSESDWQTDPIASRLKDHASPELRQSVVRFAIEGERNRQQR